MYKSHNIILGKFVEKVRNYSIMFKDIMTFLGLNYRDTSLKILYFVVLAISIPKIRSILS